MISKHLKKIPFIFFIMFLSNLFAQKTVMDIVQYRRDLDNFVGAFYSKKTSDTILIHKKPNGKVITKLIPYTDEDYCWYLFAFSESKNGWLKIEHIGVLTYCEDSSINKDIEKYKGKWVLAKNFNIMTFANKDVNVNFYEKPSKDSKIIFTIDDYLELELLETFKGWAKIKTIIDEKEHTGWIEKKHQCALPWTTCPIWE